MEFMVYDWMIKDLKLKGIERDVFAYLWKYNGDIYDHTSNFLAKQLCTDETSIDSAINTLKKRKLITERNWKYYIEQFLPVEKQEESKEC